MTEVWVWTVISFIGVCVGGWRINSSVIELKLINQAVVDGLAKAVVLYRLRAQIVREIVFILMLFDGTLALLIREETLSGFWLRYYAPIVVWVLVTCVGLLTLNSIWDESGDRKIMDMARAAREGKEE